MVVVVIQQYQTNPYKSHSHHINVEAPFKVKGLDGLLSRLQLWPPGLTKAPLGAGVEKLNLYPQITPQETQIVKIFNLYQFSLYNETYIM